MEEFEKEVASFTRELKVKMLEFFKNPLDKDFEPWEIWEGVIGKGEYRTAVDEAFSKAKEQLLFEGVIVEICEKIKNGNSTITLWKYRLRKENEPTYREEIGCILQKY